jgi:hypothetical protein
MAAPYFPGLYATGQAALTGNQNLAIPSNFVAGENPLEAQALQMMVNMAPNLGTAAPSLSNLASQIAGGYFLNPQNDPTFQGAASAALQPLYQTTTEKLLPMITHSSILGGGAGAGPSAYGGANAGSAADIENERVLRDFFQTGGATTAAMANASRAQGMNILSQAPMIAAAANQQFLAPSQAIGAAGTQEQAYAQQAINNLLQQYQYQLQAPWQGVQPFANLLTTGGFTSGTGTSNTQGTYTPAQPSMATQILQGALGAAGIAGSLFGVPGGAGGMSAAQNIFNMGRNLFGGGAAPGLAQGDITGG